ncbi:hypothetical protein ACFX2B_008349 [Malus domestica]
MIQRDICGLIHPSCGPFRYFIVLVDISTRWSHVYLLSTRNVAFSKLLAQVIKLMAHHADYPIKSIQLDNVREFTSKTVDDYCMSIRVEVKHHVPHVHTHNGLTEAFIKRLQMIARLLVIRTKLLIAAWGHAIFHTAILVRLPVAIQLYSTLQLVTGYGLDILYLCIFCCLVYVSISLSLHIKIGPQQRMRIYVRYDSSSIIHYLEPLTGDLFTAYFTDCHFYKTVFLSLRGDKNVNVPEERRELLWTNLTLSHLDPRTAQCETKVQRLLDLQSMPDTFTDLALVTIPHILAANAPTKIDVPNVRWTSFLKTWDTNFGSPHTLAASQSSALTQKCDGPLGSKDSHPRKKKPMAQAPEEPTVNPIVIYSFYPTHEEILDYKSVLEETNPPPENHEISVYYASLDDVLSRNEMIVDDSLAYAVATEIMLSDDIEPHSIDEC